MGLIKDRQVASIKCISICLTYTTLPLITSKKWVKKL